jgi:hypothetical protein
MTITSPLTDIRFLLPLSAGQRVLLPAGQPELASALTADGLQVATAGEETVDPMTGAIMDHAILPDPPAERTEAFISQAVNALKPGGYLLFALLNKHWRLHGLRPWLAKQGLTMVAIYGVHPGLHKPSVLVPLMDSKPTHFFLRRRYIPYSFGSRAVYPLALWLASWELHWLLFKEWFVVGRRPSAGLSS